MLNLFASCRLNYAVVGEELRLLENYAVFTGRLSPMFRKHLLPSHPTVNGHNISYGDSQSLVPAECPPSYSVIARAMCTNPPAGRYLVFSKRGKKVIRSVSVCSRDDMPVSRATTCEIFTNRDDVRNIHKPRLLQTFVSFMGSVMGIHWL